ncbi:GerMN domain-containing protein [Naasia lichenicola]|uniref:GerMN domain-containing protein n=1 Tax=Naasia lichenicola TaxID=2565933 RepID=A0A4S4FNB4_9MICO|nr:GerMN domain-containing protein [Naasia lichenicola]THG30712.1 hypothetical protein E6C64_08715 [Naasia lichenicola]THG31949.1 hypothetical protein E6C64_07860 [Naasia lichenicola]
MSDRPICRPIRRSRGRTRMLTLIGGLLAGAIALSGCATIPLSGSVQAGNRADAEAPPSTVFSPSGPTDGAAATEIVEGFIAAGTGPQDNYKVARQYLSAAFATTWDPSASVLVHQQATTVLESEGEVHLVVPAVASVDSTGRYTELAEGDPFDLGFTLVQEDGQWRISDAPDGVVLLRQQFETLFAQRALYFYDSSYNYLVPDLRWFPSTADSPTRIVEALLAGPAAPLLKSVFSAFPPGTRLARQSVPTTGGIADVELNDVVATADSITQQRMKLQLASSLEGGSIASVRINVDGRNVAIPEFGEGGPVLEPLVNARPLVLSNGTFGLVGGSTTTSLGPIGEAIAGLQPIAVTMPTSFDSAAVLTPSGVQAVSATGAAALVDDRADLIAPGLDGGGIVWSVPSTDPANLRAVTLEGVATPIEVPWTDATAIRSMAVSRDSTRLLVLLDIGGASVLRVYGIIRDEQGSPFTLSDDAYELVLPAGTGITTTWVDESSVATLVRVGEADYRVILQDIGGPSTALPRLTDAVSVVGGNGQNGLRVLTQSGDVEVLRGTNWQATVSGVQLLATQR